LSNLQKELEIEDQLLHTDVQTLVDAYDDLKSNFKCFHYK